MTSDTLIWIMTGLHEDDLSELRREFETRNWPRCHDGFCGATDCPRCHPENFKNGVFVADDE